MIHTDILVIGGGAAGMAAALAAYENGASVVLAERSETLGGILNRCTHHGFGLGYYGEDLTGTEYAARYRRKLEELLPCPEYPSERSAHEEHADVTILTGTTVLEVHSDRTALLASSGCIQKIAFRVLILAAGSYERPAEYLMTAGTRPSGVMTAGCAQGLINEGGLDIGDRIVVLGSGNVGQIMAGQLSDAGKTIVAMVEQNDRPGGIERNIHEYIEGRKIPLILNSTICRIHGSSRINGVTVRDLISRSETFIPCDTLITALGLIPDTTLIGHLIKDDPESRQSVSGQSSSERTSSGYSSAERSSCQSMPDWIIPAGNCDRIYDFADAVTSAGEQAGKEAAALLQRLQ